MWIRTLGLAASGGRIGPYFTHPGKIQAGGSRWVDQIIYGFGSNGPFSPESNSALLSLCSSPLSDDAPILGATDRCAMSAQASG